MIPPVYQVGCDPMTVLIWPLVFILGVGVGLLIAGLVVRWKARKERETWMR